MADEIFGTEGRYDEHAIRVLKATEATAVVLIVVGGNKGYGLSVAVDPRSPEGIGIGMGERLPELLRLAADAIENASGPDGLRVTEREKG